MHRYFLKLFAREQERNIVLLHLEKFQNPLMHLMHPLQNPFKAPSRCILGRSIRSHSNVPSASSYAQWQTVIQGRIHPISTSHSKQYDNSSKLHLPMALSANCKFKKPSFGFVGKTFHQNSLFWVIQASFCLFVRDNRDNRGLEWTISRGK